MSLQQFNHGMKPFEEPAFREQLNEVVDAVNKLMMQKANLTTPPAVQVSQDSPLLMTGFFPVLLEIDAATPDAGTGAPNAFSGDASTECSYKYTLKTLDGTVVFAGAGAVSPASTTTLSPEWRLQNLGQMLSGDGKVGMAYFGDDGEIKLYSAAEKILLEVC